MDSEFCSAEHRIESRVLLNNGLADADPADEPWPVAERARRKNSSSTGSVIFLLIGAVGVMAAISYSNHSPGQAPDRPARAPASTEWLRALSQSVTKIVPGQTSTKLVDDFRSGISDWTGETAGRRHGRSGSGAWSFTTEGMRPGRLRIWQKSRDLADYQFDFQARIDRKAVGWAFRALNPNNCYAAKLSVGKTRTTLTRFVKLDGLEFDRTAEPLPVAVRAGEFCRVRVSVHADHFLTFINDELVASWSDRRLQHGGVGFFTDDGEGATVRWVGVTQRDSFMGRMLSYFSLVRMPMPAEN